MSVLACCTAVTVGLVLFAMTLIVITFCSAWVADLTGHFRTLFVRQPTRGAFRVARYAAAGLVTVGVVDALVLEALL